MKVTITDDAIIFKTKIFESRTKNKDKIYIKYRCSIPSAISDYTIKSATDEAAAKLSTIYIYPDTPNGRLIKIGTDAEDDNTADTIADNPDAAADVIRRKIYLSGTEYKVYNFLIPNKLLNDNVYTIAVFTVTNDRSIYLTLE